MSKYPFFGKRGRPSKAESEICKKINSLIDGGEISQSEIDVLLDTEGVPENQEELETLYAYLTGESPDGAEQATPNNDNISNDNLDDGDYSDFEESQDFSEATGGQGQAGGSSGIGGDAVDFDPFAEPVIERGYTDGEFHNQNEQHEEASSSGVEFENDDFEQPENLGNSVADDVGGGSDGDIPNQNFDSNSEETEEDIPEPQWNNTVEDVEFDESEEEEHTEKEPLGGDNLEDMTPAQKRKSAEKTAEAILDMYCRFAPLPFKSWASIKDGKVQKMVFNNEINPNMQIENGVTVQDYIDGVNEQVEEIFTVDEDTRESIKDPLIDVLMEQELALTPTQRLLMAVGSHVVTMGFSAFQLSQNNKQALETFKEFHAQQRGATSGTSSTRQSSEPKPQSQGHPVYSSAEEFSEHDKGAVEDLMRELNQDDDGVIDAEHDPNITVEDVTDED